MKEELKEIYKSIKITSLSSNKNIVYYFCAYVPPELIYASNHIPFRLLPSPTYFDRTDEFIPKYLCPYLRSITEEILRKDISLQKVIFTDGCDSSKRIYEVWKDLSFSYNTYFLQIPFNEKEEDIKYYGDQLRNLFYSLDYKEERLIESIELYNLARRKIKNLEIEGVGRGSFLYLINNIFHSIDIEEFLNMNFSFKGKRGIGRFYLFSTMFPLEFIEFLEEFNLEIYFNDSCFGDRIQEEIKFYDDPFYSLSNYILKREGCVRRKSFNEKISMIIKRVREENIKGVIFYSLKYCDPLLFTIPILREKLREEKIPTLIIEDDYSLGIKEQIRIRIEAFLEMIL